MYKCNSSVFCRIYFFILFKLKNYVAWRLNNQKSYTCIFFIIAKNCFDPNCLSYQFFFFWGGNNFFVPKIFVLNYFFRTHIQNCGDVAKLKLMLLYPSSLKATSHQYCQYFDWKWLLGLYGTIVILLTYCMASKIETTHLYQLNMNSW